MRKRTMLLTGAALCALSACSLAPATALAQPAPPAAAASADDEGRGDNARATQLYREGNDAFKQKRWSDAELLYLKAWALVRSFDIAANLGEVQIQLKKPRSAATFLAFALRTAPPSTKPEQIARIRHFLDEAKAQVGVLRVRVKNVADAEVLVDGERVPEDAVKHEVYVEPGERTLVIRRAGYEDEVMRLIAAAGVTETVMPELKPKAVKAPETTGPEAKAPAVMAPMPRKAGWSSPPTVPARPEGPRTAVLIGGAATAGAAAIAGVVLTFLANANGSDADTERSRLRSAGGTGACGASDPRAGCRELSESVDDRYAFSNAAFWSFASAGAVGVGTLVYGLATRRSVPDRHVHVTPIVRASSLGIVVGGVL
ncbi:hypothetical protein [Sorangium sp. So ce363]|uniref:hypothetical protein n=1 Tax=Sorangium sp. So ce363 TaxID=3133304 RepID=UPI003F62D893